MNKQWFALLVVLLALAPGRGNAAQFSILGPRAMGMGGASVAEVNDATAVYWNPAALAAIRKVDIRMSAELTAQDHMGLKDKWTQINDLNAEVQAGDPQAINEMTSLVNQLDVPDTPERTSMQRVDSWYPSLSPNRRSR